MNWENYFDQAVEARENENYEYAIELLNELVRLDDGKEQVFELLGDCYFRMRAFDDAINSYSKALGLNSNMPKTTINLAQCYLTIFDFHSAIPYYKRAIRLYPSEVFLYVHLGICYVDTGEYSVAIENFLYANKLNPKWEVPYLLLGKVYIKTGEYHSSIRYLLDAIRLKPTIENGHLHLAEAYAGLKDYDQSISNYITAIELKPQSEDLLIDLASIYNKAGDEQEAIHCLLQACKVNQGSERPYEELGEIYFQKQEYSQALHYFIKGLAIAPNSGDINYRLGVLYLVFENFKIALGYLLTALKNGCEGNFVYNNIAYCYVKESDVPHAEKYYLKALEYGEPGATEYNGLGNCSLKKGDYTKAIEYFNLALNIDPDLMISYYNIGNCYATLEQYAEARRYFELASEREGFKGHLFMSIYHLPQSVFKIGEPSGFSYFLKAIQEDLSKFRFFNLEDLLRITLENEAPLLFYHLLGNMYFDTPETIIRRPDFAEVARLSKPFRQQLTIWESDRKAGTQSLLAEALINFYMGNPIRAYQIFNERIERDAATINLIADYYFVLSARAIGKCEGKYLEINLLPKVYSVLNNPAAVLTDKYYAALILELGGETANAMGQLEYQAANGYDSAKYALAQFKRMLFVNETDYDTEVLTEFLEWHLAQENYFRLPIVIRLDEDEHTLVNKLLPLVQLMENKTLLENLAALRNNPTENIFEQRFFFSRYIEFVHLDELIEGNVLEKNNPVIYEKIYGNDEERELIEPEIEIFKIREKNQIGVHSIVTDLHKGTFADFKYIKDNLTLPPDKTNYRHYMVLVITLQEQGLINVQTLLLLQQYITYCAEAVYAISGKNEVLDYALSKLKEQIVTFSLFGLSLEDLAQIYSLAHNRVHGVKSEVLSYQEFLEVSKKQVAPN